MSTLKTTTDDFLTHCKFEKNLSEKTLKAYRTDLLQLRTFLDSSFYPMEMEEITKQHLREFLVSIASLKPKSIKRKVATIKAMFNYLEFEDLLLVNPLRKMRIRIKEAQALPTVMDLREVVKIFKVGYKLKNEIKNETSYAYIESIRNIAVLELLFSTGARVSEIANLKTDNINLHTGNVIIKGKGNKERVVQICNKESIAILKSYYCLFESKINSTGGYFLINRFNKHLSDQSIRNIVKKLVHEAGISKRITPHIFRHSFATLLLEKDVDIKYIQSLLGHSSINTTQIYTHVNRKRQRQLLNTRHPRRDFSMMLSTSE
jgi:integrase/recombinase XerD